MRDHWNHLRPRTVGQNFASVGNLTVEYHTFDSTGEDVHHQVYEGGTLVLWGSGPARDPDLVLRQPRSLHVNMLLRSELGAGLVEGTEVLAVGGGTPRWGPPPTDELRSDWADALPEVPGAPDLLVQQTLTASPFGDLTTHFTVERGRVIAAGYGQAPTPNVEVVRRYALALAERAGEIDLFESFEGGGRIVGSTPDLTLFLGIYDSDACIDARRRLDVPPSKPLGVLGDVLSSDGWRQAVAPYATAAAPMGSVP